MDDCKVLWKSNVDQPSFPSLTKEDAQDVCDAVIIGGGFTGLSSAYYIKKANPQLSVYLLEAESIGSGASGRGFGIISPFLEKSFALKAEKEGRDRTLKDLRLRTTAIGYLRSLAKEINCEIREKEYLLGGEANRITAEFKAMQDVGVTDVKKLDNVEEIQSSMFKSEFYDAGIVGKCSSLNPHELILRLAEACTKVGVKIFEKSKAQKVKRYTPTVIKVNGCELVANCVVMATNGYSYELGYLDNRVFPMQTAVLVTEKLSSTRLESLNWVNRDRVAFECSKIRGCTLMLTDDNRICIWGTHRYFPKEFPWKSIDTKACESELLVELIKRFPQLSKIEIEHSWTGVLGVTKEYIPGIGDLEDKIEDHHLFFAAGFTGNDMALSVYYGKLIGELLFGKGSSDLDYVLESSVPPWLGFPWMRQLVFNTLYKRKSLGIDDLLEDHVKLLHRLKLLLVFVIVLVGILFQIARSYM